MHRFYFLILFSGFFTAELCSQNITTEGTDFWFGFMENHETSRIDLEIFISANDSTGGTLRIPGAFFTQVFSVKKDSTVQITIPSNLAMATGSEVIQKKGIHIVTEKPVTVFALNKRSRSADATVVLPTVSLGKEYFAMAHVEPSGGGPSLNSEILIVAVADQTEIEITPSVYTTGGNAPGLPFRIMLNEGETYQIQSPGDLTGTYVTATNTTQGDCRNFALFGGNEWTRIGGCGGAQDHLFEQMFPLHAWGKEFYTLPYKTRRSGDLFKILASEDSTLIKITGLGPFYLNRGVHYSRRLYNPSIITADKPISVAQFSLSQSCDNVEADPFMIMVSPVEQLLEKITFDAFSIHVVDHYYVNILRKNTSNASFWLDDTEISDQFLPFPEDEAYSWTSLEISEGIHTIACADGFSAVVYGYGDIESFGYATGVSINNLNLEILSAWVSEPSFPDDRACIGSELFFEAFSENEFVQFEWDFSDGTVISAPEASHSFSKTGIYPVKLKAFTANGSCASLEEAVKLIHIVKPVVKIIGPSSVCPNTAEVGYKVVGEDGNQYHWWAAGGQPDRLLLDSAYINWGVTSDQAYLATLPVNNLGCTGDTLQYPVKINVQLDPDLPLGIDSLCSIDRLGQDYQSFFIQHTQYLWEVRNGDVVAGQDEYQIMVDWQQPGEGMLWYRQISLLDEVCDGTSDTLHVFIERAPDQEILIQTEQITVQSGDSVELNLQADESFTHFSWNLGDGLQLDSLPGQRQWTHLYNCDGTYEVNVQGFTSNICPVPGNGSINLTVLPPEVRIDAISETAGQQSNSLNITYTFNGSGNYSRPLFLNRKRIYPEPGNWEVLGQLSPDQQSYTDPVNTTEEIYQYYISTNQDCPLKLETPLHQNILNMVINDGEKFTSQQHTAYQGWDGGIDRYEIWRSKDGEAFQVFDVVNSLEQVYEYQMDGFEYCYQVKAINDLETSHSWSNISCDNYVPELATYNIFTPNTDNKNPTFQIDRIELYPGSFLRVYNRFGKTVFETTGYRNDWDGTRNGQLLPSGVYYYVLRLNEERSEVKELKGWIQILY